MTPVGGARPGAGRKPYQNSSEIRKTRSIRFSDREWAQLEQQAKENGHQNISDYLRSLAKLDNKNEEEIKMLKKRIEKEIEKKFAKFGVMGTEEVNITLNLTDSEKEEFLNEISDSFNYKLDGNELSIIWSEGELKINASIRAIFDNGGGLTLQLGDWAHWYSDNIDQAAEDYLAFVEECNTDGWDGHEKSEAVLEPTSEQIANGGYRVYWEEELEHLINDDDLNSWGNVNDFCKAVRKLRSEQK